MTLKDYGEIIGLLSKFKQTGDNKGVACCPAHDDNTPSLTVGLGQDHRLLVKCWRGCAFRRIAEAIGVKPNAFFPPRDKKRIERWDLYESWDYTRDLDGVEVLSLQAFTLINEVGEVKRRVRRPNPLFNPIKPAGDGNSEWLYNLDGVPPTLYGLAKLGSEMSRAVWLVPDEPTVDFFAQQGLLAVCSPIPFGPKNADDYCRHLAGRNVGIVVTPFASEAYKEYVVTAAASLVRIASQVRVVGLTGGPETSGIGDWWAKMAKGDDDKLAQAAALAALRQAWASAPVQLRTAVDVRMPEQPAPEAINAQYAGRPALTADLAKRLFTSLRMIPLDDEDAGRLLPDGVRYDPDEASYLFPEVTAGGVLSGLVRRFAGGRKYCVVGSHRGLYLVKEADYQRGPILCVEGASDTLACAKAGLTVVGRHTNSGGVDLLHALFSGQGGLFKKLPASVPIVIVGENDRKEQRKPDGSEDWPGKEGAESVAAELTRLLNRKIQVAFPPQDFKDARAWLTARTGPWEDRGRAFLAACGLVAPTDPLTAAESVRLAESLIHQAVTAGALNPPTLEAMNAAVEGFLDLAGNTLVEGKSEYRLAAARAVAAIINFVAKPAEKKKR